MRIAVAGGFGFGLTVFVPRVPAPGETLPGGRLLSSPGGKASNQAVAAARLGADVALFAAVGSDAYGEAGRDLWAREGVDASAVPTFDAPSMVGIILVDPTGENRIVLAEGALDRLTPHHVTAFEPMVGDADVLLISSEIPVDVVERLVEVGRRADVRVILNPAPVLDFSPETLSSVDILTPNRSEAALLAGLDPSDDSPDGAESIARVLHERTGAAVVLTLGAHGVMVVDATGVEHVAPVPVERIVDTTGAGDAFNGAFAVAVARGDTLRDAAAFGARAGAFAVQREEVIPALPTTRELDEVAP